MPVLPHIWEHLFNPVSGKAGLLTTHKVTRDSWKHLGPIHNPEHTPKPKRQGITSRCVRVNESPHAKSPNVGSRFIHCRVNETREEIKRNVKSIIKIINLSRNYMSWNYGVRNMKINSFHGNNFPLTREKGRHRQTEHTHSIVDYIICFYTRISLKYNI